MLSVSPLKRLSAEEALKHPWLKDAKVIMKDVFTEKEKAIILKDYHRLSVQDTSFACIDRIETDFLLTEHPLDTQHNDDLPEGKRNINDRSVVLAPFNSLISLNDTLDDG